MKYKSSKSKNFYLEYSRIGSKSYHDKVRCYEENALYVSNLNYDEQIAVNLDYVLCLFEIGKYHKFLSIVDRLIETVIIDNIYEFAGVNIYNDLLFKKAACLHNTGQYIKSEKILKAIIKLEPENSTARALFGGCKRKRNNNRYNTIKTFGLVLFLCSIFTGLMEFIIIRSYYVEYESSFSVFRILFLVSGILLLIGNKMYLYSIVGKEIGYDFSFKEIKKLLNKIDK